MEDRDPPRGIDEPALVELRGVHKHYPVTAGLLRRSKGVVRAVDGIDLTIPRGRTLGLVGESGCGKSTLGRLTLRLEETTAGSVLFDGHDLGTLSDSDLKRFRRRMQIIFQDPYASLNPRLNIGRTVGEGLLIHGIGSRAERQDRVHHLMERVGLPPDHAGRYPHQFSGGQRQRIGIARALAVQPDFVVCDEPLSALDVSIQAQIINLLQDLQEQFRLTYLFISHDLSVVRHLSDRIAVMYAGQLVELADATELYANPLHPYTRSLLEAIPSPDPRVRRSKHCQPPDLSQGASTEAGCRFHRACRHALRDCREQDPPLAAHSITHWVRCLRVPAATRCTGDPDRQGGPPQPEAR
jgi:peptide/nickel transport system ATP-binding protein/oligopeptide transport system ATP-binding protein